MLKSEPTTAEAQAVRGALLLRNESRHTDSDKHPTHPPAEMTGECLTYSSEKGHTLDLSNTPCRLFQRGNSQDWRSMQRMRNLRMYYIGILSAA